MFTEVLVIAASVIGHPGGDCFANRATGDTWKVGNEWYCGVVPADAEIKKVKINGTAIEPAAPVITVEEIVVEDTPVVTDEPAETPAPAPVVDTPAQGNPGNDKAVGNAGEKCDKSMCENADGQSGEHGKSGND